MWVFSVGYVQIMWDMCKFRYKGNWMAVPVRYSIFFLKSMMFAYLSIFYSSEVGSTDEKWRLSE